MKLAVLGLLSWVEAGPDVGLELVKAECDDLWV